MRILGLDPGLHRTGWGVLDEKQGRLSHIAHGTLTTCPGDPIPTRLLAIFEGLKEILKIYCPDEASVEEIFVNKNPLSSLKLGLARGIVLMTPAHAGIRVQEYPSTTVKKALVGHGHAQKEQVGHMVRFFLPKIQELSKDAADALALAICHAHMGPQRSLENRLKRSLI